MQINAETKGDNARFFLGIPYRDLQARGAQSPRNAPFMCSNSNKNPYPFSATRDISAIEVEYIGPLLNDSARSKLSGGRDTDLLRTPR